MQRKLFQKQQHVKSLQEELNNARIESQEIVKNHRLTVATLKRENHEQLTNLRSEIVGYKNLSKFLE